MTTAYRNRRRYGLLTRGVLGGGSGEFSPPDIAGLQLWYDAADASTLFQDSALTTPALADGDVVGGWLDKSGNGRNATQGTTGSKPTLKTGVANDRNAVRFDGSDDWLEINYSLSASVHTVFVIYNATTVSGVDRFVFDTQTGRLALGHLGNVAGQTGFFNATTWRIIAPAMTGLQLIEYWLITGTNQALMRRNGSQIGSNAQYNAQAIGGTTRLGNSIISTATFPGDILEYLDYNVQISLEEAVAVRNYLNTKWAVY